MRIIHCADLHLDSKMESCLPSDKAKERKNEILMSYLRMIEYARKNWVNIILIAGDMFDTKNVSAKVKNVVVDSIRNNPGISFLCLKGNHDTQNFLETMNDRPDNLYFFGDSWTKYEFEDVVISGIELNDNNSELIYDSLLLDPRRVNIVMMHGQEAECSGGDNIKIKSLKDKYIDYLALGHVHSYKMEKLDQRGVYAYSGCMDARGFDEAGEKGFIVINVDNGKVATEFVPNYSRRLYNLTVDISGADNSATILKKVIVATEGISPDSLVKVNLVGRLDIEVEKDISYVNQYLLDTFYFGRVKDLTKVLINPDDYKYDPTLRGEFVRLVLGSYLEDDVKEKVIMTGVKALLGEELD